MMGPFLTFAPILDFSPWGPRADISSWMTAHFPSEPARDLPTAHEVAATLLEENYLLFLTYVQMEVTYFT